MCQPPSQTKILKEEVKCVCVCVCVHVHTSSSFLKLLQEKPRPRAGRLAKVGFER